MEFNSPQPEHAQLGVVLHPKAASGLLAALHQQVLSATQRGDKASLDSVLDEQLIPSPPLSPKMTADCDIVAPLALSPPESAAHAILVKPLCDPHTSPRRYRSATHGFLSQYRCLDLNRSNKRYTHASNKTLRRTRNYTLSPAMNSGNSDFERTYRTRRVTGGNSGAGGVSNGARHQHSRPRPLEFSRDSTPIPRPSTPTSRHRKTTTVSSPLASAAAVSAPNMSWEKLPDYSPPLSSLPNNNKCLKVEWKGSSMDLSDDPLKQFLHPAELQLAQILRLPCDLYLDSKRRLFLEKMHRMKQNLAFRRTDAQKACRIDVNKASRLFAAYERIGWLQDDKFEKFL
ncbi:LANO_0C01728g1_1 [Lachancea nothofagi CBS 11611]|uniref:LANO_0C01728g1_1 n=1 Tax=Lachancea nothofagi CBS 11611 TaxID=1266666 RepID=A0A1G4J501_9SACH|nr:LANO_0C01728g1_1 [Lachancea nothofagi CBS 11611]